MLIDTHCHLYLKGLDSDLPGVISRAKEAGVARFICPGIDLETSRTALTLAETNASVYAAAGWHPHDAKDVPTGYLKELEMLLSSQKMVAVGEIGLDYYWDNSPRDTQQMVFREQILLAQSLGLPIIVHNRDASEDVLRILQETNMSEGVAHCYSGDIETALAFIELGFYISFAGNLTFKNSGLSDVAKALPLEKILLETDAPFLSPAPFRGKPNEPARLSHTALKLAEVTGNSLEEIATVIDRNAAILFNL